MKNLHVAVKQELTRQKQKWFFGKLPQWSNTFTFLVTVTIALTTSSYVAIDASFSWLSH